MRDTVASTFSGGKLYDVGAMAAGLRPLWGVEYDAKIAAVAELNVPAPCLVARVEEVDYSTLETPWLLHMSPVCKNASQAKTDAGEQPEDIEMAAGCIRAIEALRPRVITLENVWGYRTFQAFKNILHALKSAGYAVGYWHLNSADYGVPQTRKRLILMASLDFQPVKPPPTHRKRVPPPAGQLAMFDVEPALPGWIGWYAAIADLIPTLPETQPAPWQLARMPKEIRESLLLAQGCFGDDQVIAEAAYPSHTITSNSNQLGTRAYIIGGGNTGSEYVTSKARLACDPMFTVAAQEGAGSPVRALLVESENQGSEWGKGYREGAGSAPSLTSRTTYPRALLVDGDNASRETGESWARRSDQPAMTMRGGRAAAHRAFLMQGTSTLDLRGADEPSAVCVATVGAKATPPKAFIGRWVKMTIQALGRFQTVPDSYQGLTAEINGNGVPCLLAQRLVESAIEQDQRRKG